MKCIQSDRSILGLSVQGLVSHNYNKNYYCTSGRAVEEKTWFKAVSTGPTVGRTNTEVEN